MSSPHKHHPVEALLGLAAKAQPSGEADECVECASAVSALRRARPILDAYHAADEDAAEPIEVPYFLANVTRGRQIAEELLAATHEHDTNDLDEVLERSRHDPAFASGALQALQLAAKIAPKDPVAALTLAGFVSTECVSFPHSEVSSETLRGEADILYSQVQLVRGDTAGALEVAQAGRAHLQAAGADPFALARAEYFIASALGFCGRTAEAIRLFETSVETFERYGQDDWSAKALAARALAMTMERDDPDALPFFDLALEKLTAPEDANNVASILQNKALLFLALGRKAEAHETFEKCLATSLRHGLRSIALSARVNLIALALDEGRADLVLQKADRLLAQAEAERMNVAAYVLRLLLAEASLANGRVADADHLLADLAAAAPVEIRTKEMTVDLAGLGLTAAQRSAAEAGKWLQRVRRRALGWGEREEAAV